MEDTLQQDDLCFPYFLYTLHTLCIRCCHGPMVGFKNYKISLISQFLWKFVNTELNGEVCGEKVTTADDLCEYQGCDLISYYFVAYEYGSNKHCNFIASIHKRWKMLWVIALKSNVRLWQVNHILADLSAGNISLISKNHSWPTL